MKIYRIANWYAVKEFDGDTGYPADSCMFWTAIKMKDGTIWYGPSHYDIVHKLKTLYSYEHEEVDDGFYDGIESFGFLGADGVYQMKSNKPISYGRENNYW